VGDFLPALGSKNWGFRSFFDEFSPVFHQNQELTPSLVFFAGNFEQNVPYMARTRT
jgi:hypothetical protein